MKNSWRTLLTLAIVLIHGHFSDALGEDVTAPLNGTVSFGTADAVTDKLLVDAGAKTIKAVTALKVHGHADSRITKITTPDSGIVHVADVIKREGSSLYRVIGTHSSGGNGGSGVKITQTWDAEYSRGVFIRLEINAPTSFDDLVGKGVGWSEIHVRLVDGEAGTTYHVTNIASSMNNIDFDMTNVDLDATSPEAFFFVKGTALGKFTLTGDCDNGAVVIPESGEVVNPIKTPHGDPATTAGANNTNEIVFDGSAPGEATVKCLASHIVSDPSDLYWSIHVVQPNLTELVGKWDKHLDGTELTGIGRNPIATFTELPSDNESYGLNFVHLRSFTGHLLDEATQDIEFFYNRNARNHPGNVSEGENWFYYWNQTDAGGVNATWTDDAITDHAGGAKVPAMSNWTTFAGLRDQIDFSTFLRIVDDFTVTRRDGSNVEVTGIDAYHTIFLHEKRHVKQIEDANTLPFYKDDSGVSREAAASGWAWFISGDPIPPTDPKYNRFDPGPDGKPGVVDVDDDNNEGKDESDEFLVGVGGDVDLDPDRDGLGTDPRPGGKDFDNGATGVEAQAQAAETNAEDLHARDDWGSPGKNHRTLDKFND